MKGIRFLLLVSICGLATTQITNAQNINKEYDAKLAKELNADDYGMKKYVLVILKSVSGSDLSKEVKDSVFRGHMDNINKLVKEGKLVVAGPLGKNELNYRGIFILDVEEIEEARKLVDMDPVIKSKMMAAEYFPWFGSAALKETLKIHKKIEKKAH